MPKRQVPRAEKYEDGIRPDDLPAIVHAFHQRQSMVRELAERQATVAEPWETGKRSTGGIWIPKAEDLPRHHGARIAHMLGLTLLARVFANTKPMDPYPQKPGTCNSCYGCHWLCGDVLEPLVVVITRTGDSLKGRIKPCGQCNALGATEFRDPWTNEPKRRRKAA